MRTRKAEDASKAAGRPPAALPLKFPPLRSVLYDNTSLSQSILLTSSVCAPLIRVEAHVLASLLGRGSRSCLVLGKPKPVDEASLAKLAEDTIGGEWEYFIDAFDHGDGSRFALPTETSLATRLHRPLFIRAVAKEEDMIEDAVRGWFDLTTRFRMSDGVRIFVSQTLHSSTTSTVSFTCLAPSVRFICRRIPTPVFLKTPLLNKLKGQDENFADLQYGLLTLNETRKAVVLLEDDPLAYQVPVVGIWFKNTFQTRRLVRRALRPEEDGESYYNDLAMIALRDPAVFAGCVRYVANTYLHEKVCPLDSPRTFLVCFILDNGHSDIFLEVSSSTLDSNQLFDKYEARISFDQGSEQNLYTAEFKVQDDIIKRLRTKQLASEEFKRSNPRLDWLEAEPVPNSDRLLMQIAELLHENDRDTKHSAPARSIPEVQPFEDVPLPLPVEEPERPMSSKAAGRVNLLVDFIARQQQEIADLRRIVTKLEDSLQQTALPKDSDTAPSQPTATTAEIQDSEREASFDFSHQSPKSDHDHGASHHDYDSGTDDEELAGIEQKYLRAIQERQAVSSDDEGYESALE